MATYKGIQGYTVQKLSEDPTASEAVGQLWYNSGTGKFKVAVAGAGAWATGGTAGTSAHNRGTAGTLTTAIADFPGGVESAYIVSCFFTI